MKVLVLGGNGATGYHVVKQLLENNVNVKTIIRNPSKLKSLGNPTNLKIIIDSNIYFLLLSTSTIKFNIFQLKS